MTTTTKQGLTRQLAALVALIIVTAAQFLIGYQNIEGGALARRMATFAAIEILIVVFLLMNLGSEKKSFVKFFTIFMLFVLTTMNIIWTDSFRLLVFRLTKIGPS